jgi:ElaB/YqjD/DUF883 family membrane-anchored ribosome-binding protein
MNADTLAHATEQAKAELSEIADRLRDLSETVTERCRERYRDAEYGARKLRIAVEKGIDDTRREIKSHPLASVAVAASGAFFLGGLAGRFAGRRGRR